MISPPSSLPWPHAPPEGALGTFAGRHLTGFHSGRCLRQSFPSNDAHATKLNALNRIVIGIRRLVRDHIQDVHALDDIAEHGVLTVQLRLRDEADIKLAAVAAALRINTIRKSRSRHCASGVLAPDFRRKRITGASRADVRSVLLFAPRIAHL